MMTRSLVKFFSALVIVIGLASVSYAQESADNDIIRPITKQGSAGFLFSIGGIGTFGISGPGIGFGNNAQFGAGMRYYLADDLALRVLLAFQNASVDSNTVNGTPKSSNTSFGIGAGIEHHFRPLYSLSPYVAGQVGYTSSSNSVGSADAKTTNSQFSVAALAGFDWYFTRGIALGAEVGLGFASNSVSSPSTPAGIVEGGVQPFGKTTSPSQPTTFIGLFTNSDVHLFVHF